MLKSILSTFFISFLIFLLSNDFSFSQTESKLHSSPDLIINSSGEKVKYIDVSNSSSSILFSDSFENMNNWTILGPLGLTNWHIQNSNFAQGIAAPELDIKWTPIFIGDSYILSPQFIGLGGHNLELTFMDYLTWWADSMTVGVAITSDGGTTYNSIWEITKTSTYGPSLETINFSGIENMQIALYYKGNSNNIDDWFIDDLILNDLSATPVELTSFTGLLRDNKVILNWSTASEINNRGFEIEKAQILAEQTGILNWNKIGFVNGHGTTSGINNYSYIDENQTAGNYQYRLKQIDFNGITFYSNIIEVNFNIPVEFILNQNFPNPFNPATNINFNLPVDSYVTLKVFNILGQEVETLLNKNINAGAYNVIFNTSGFNSGVYLYELDAKGVNGINYTSVRKMILTK